MKFIEIARWLKQEGYELIRQKGSHSQFRHPQLGRISVPLRPNPDLIKEIRCQVRRAKEGRSPHNSHLRGQ